MTWKPPAQGTKKREAMPANAFLVPSEKKYPYKTKRNGEWKPSKIGLQAAIRRAAQQGDMEVKNKAERILHREFPETKK